MNRPTNKEVAAVFEKWQKEVFPKTRHMSSQRYIAMHFYHLGKKEARK